GGTGYGTGPCTSDARGLSSSAPVMISWPSFLPLPEWHSETRQQAARLVVGAGCGDDRHFQPAEFVDLVVVDLREDDLLAQAQRVVAASVKALGADPAEVADARQRHVEQLVEEVPHAAAAKRRLDAHDLAGAELECGNRL